MGHNDHEVGPRIELECESCGELDLEAQSICCARCLDEKTVCFTCIPKNDERRIDPEWPWFCVLCQEAIDDE